MLEAVDQTKPTTMDDLAAALFSSRDIIARCPETGAKLTKSRGQYTLVLEEPYTTRHWSRRSVHSDQDAIERANKSLAKILREIGQLDEVDAMVQQVRADPDYGLLEGWINREEYIKEEGL